MNNCFNWLKAKLERHPVLFVLIAGPIAYILPIGLTAGGYAMGYRDAFYALLFAPVTVASFNWFVARYERRSRLAQVIAILPAMGFIFLSLASGLMMGERMITCMPEPESGEMHCFED